MSAILQHLEQAERFDTSILSHQYLSLAEPRYDFLVVDEVQDLTNIQLYLVLQTLRNAGDFLLCGDANQIVHPNFFSWSKVKTLFFEDHTLTGHAEVLRVLHANYRNSPLITAVANRLLKLKHARFGSIDKESNYLVTSTGEQAGALQLLEDSDSVKRDLDAKTGRSTRFAVLVMHPDQKAAAQRWFNTPLVFSIQEAKSLKMLYRNHFMFYDLSNSGAVLRDTEKYGIDHRTIFNLTPLMVAARLGNGALVEALIERGADPNLIGSNGLNALQMSLELALSERRYAQQKVARIYPLLAPESLSIQVEGRLIKLDNHLMGLFVLNVMFALFYRQLGNEAAAGGAFSAKVLAEQVAYLPAAILPERRKRQSYISSVLSGNEVSRDDKYNRKLFLRLRC